MNSNDSPREFENIGNSPIRLVNNMDASDDSNEGGGGGSDSASKKSKGSKFKYFDKKNSHIEKMCKEFNNFEDSP